MDTMATQVGVTGRAVVIFFRTQSVVVLIRQSINSLFDQLYWQPYP
jgi:hypothetical protein